MWKWLKALIDAFTEKSEPFKPSLERQIGYNDLHTLLKEKFPEAEIYLSDNTKYLCNLDDIEAFLEKDETDRLTFRNEAFDCDDFAYRLMGQLSVPMWADLSKGIIWTDTHAMVCCVDINEDFWYIEPQADRIQSKLEPWQGESIRFIIM